MPFLSDKALTKNRLYLGRYLHNFFAEISPQKRRVWRGFGVLLVVILALAVRSDKLSGTLLGDNELQSTLKSLSILEHGVPVGRYQGQPLFGHSLSLEWPESEEYTFKDSDVANHGLVVDQGWLPLYVIAGALAAAGIYPDEKIAGPPVFTSSADATRWRNVVPRLPSILFSCIFILAMVACGRHIAGRAGAVAAFIFAAFTGDYVGMGGQASYYSASLCLAAISMLTLLKSLKYGDIRRWCLHGVALSLLFYCHIFSCVLLCIMTLILAVPRVKSVKDWQKLAACFALVIFFAVPWLMATDYITVLFRPLPLASSFMGGPVEWLVFAYISPLQGQLFVAVVLLIMALKKERNRFPKRVCLIIKAYSDSVLFYALWIIVAFVAFAVLTPLTHYFPNQVALIIAVPTILFLTLLVAIFSELLRPKLYFLLPSMLALVVLFSQHKLDIIPTVDDDAFAIHPERLAEKLNKQQFAEGTRFYATPGMHLLFNYYTAVPVQSVAPVSLPYLEQYSGDVVYISKLSRDYRWTASVVQRFATIHTLALTDDQAVPVARKMTSYEARTAIATRLAASNGNFEGGREGTEDIPFYLQDAQQFFKENPETRPIWDANLLVFDGFDISNSERHWTVFFYRFSEPLQRLEALLQTPRLLRSQLIDVDDGVAVYRSSPL